MDSACRYRSRTRLIDAWRIATSPWRALQLYRARRDGTVPVGILFYHRVGDSSCNPWSISNKEFERQVNWLCDHFEIVSLAEAQRRIRSGANSVPTVCLTFDDGYADNCSFAVPLLIARRIPFTYFVTTRHTRSGSPFEHDVKLGQPLQPNSIDAIRAMADAGVEIGGHSRRHLDLGKIHDREVLLDEVIVATQEMSELIDHRIRYFAFPFGQIENLNATVFQLLKEHGFEGVCSAYGGWNEIGSDGFHLQRFHGDPDFARIQNWLTMDPRKRHVWQTPIVDKLIRSNAAQGANSAKSAPGNPVRSVPLMATPDDTSVSNEMVQ